MNRKQIKILIVSLENQGAVVDEVSKGYLVKFPDGSSLTMHRTESDHRATMNTRSRVKRAGLEWPFDTGRKKTA